MEKKMQGQAPEDVVKRVEQAEKVILVYNIYYIHYPYSISHIFLFDFISLFLDLSSLGRITLMSGLRLPGERAYHSADIALHADASPLARASCGQARCHASAMSKGKAS